MYFVPGNHDLPLGPNRLFSPHARDRYASHFSPPNAILEIANHSLILLDAVGLVEEDYRRYAAEMQFGEWDGVEGGVIEFVKSLGDGKSCLEGGETASTVLIECRSSAGTEDIDIAYTPCESRGIKMWAIEREGQDIEGCRTGVSELAGE
jgi:hypothetical protein